MSRSSLALALFVVGCATSAGEYVRQGGLELDVGRLDCVEGSICDPIFVGAFPFEDRRDLSAAPHAAILSNSCDWEADWKGGEFVYELNAPLPGLVSIALDADEGVRAFLLDHTRDDDCVSSGAAFSDAPVNPGTYWVLVDSDDRIRGERPFGIQIDFRATVVADDGYEPNDDEDHAHAEWYGLFDERSIRATLTPQSPVDWFVVEMDAGARFTLDVTNPMIDLHIENEDGDVLTTGPDANGAWHVEEDVGRNYGEYWIRVQLNDAQPAEAWTDYELRIAAPMGHDDVWD